ncbi:MAG: polysaccharide pyruvyl transferase family protein [Desulfuromonadales bacterium]|nr:polysaccharide pyruvyl transferase family protein [Desulfuromonadales bacterium]
MKLKYAHLKNGNFGDDLNPWLWPQCAPELFDGDDNVQFLGIGTILHRHYPASTLKVVFSSGAGYRRAPILDESWRVYCVRGKLTARLLGVSPDLAVGDGAYLLRQLRLLEAAPVAGRVGFMPHHASLRYLDWAGLCERAGLTYLDPCAPVAETLRRISSCSLVLAEAMHAAIVSDALRIPWVAVRYSHRFLDSKWHDWLSAFDLDLVIHDMPAVLDAQLPFKELLKRRLRSPLAHLPLAPARWRRMPCRRATATELDGAAEWLAALATSAVPQMTSEPALARVEQRLDEKLQKLRADFAAGLLIAPQPNPTAGVS